jgi:ABC-type branched-subunit amino acid transport system ATPase component
LVSDLSFSQQKFVEIARCLTLEPRLLLLDEPVSGLSQKERGAALEVLARLHTRGSRAILLVEHDLSFVTGIATRLVALDFGVVIAEGDPVSVLSSPEVISAYIGEEASGG